MTTSRRLAQNNPDGLIEYSPEETEAMIDSEARKLLGISGPEFRRRWLAGKYDEHAEMHRVLDIAFMLGADYLRRCP